MGKLLIEILLIVLCSSIAFVLGAIVNSGVHRKGSPLLLSVPANLLFRTFAKEFNVTGH
jgi:hypothetical protein